MCAGYDEHEYVVTLALKDYPMLLRESHSSPYMIMIVLIKICADKKAAKVCGIPFSIGMTT